MRMKAVACTALLLGALISPASATILVSVEPGYQAVPLSAGVASVQIVADIPQNEAIVGWGLDLDLVGSSVSVLGVDILAPFDAAPTADGDGLAGLLFPPATASGIVPLATVWLSLDALGTTQLIPSDDYPLDLSEGFALDPTGFAEVTYVPGAIEVTPEPASLALLGVLALLRRR